MTLTHTRHLGKAEFDFSEESGGTKNLIRFWLPWFMINHTDGSGILSVDELDSSLHPSIVADLIEKHLNSGLNTQLIFTTHDTHLMNAKALRRDQFWITERDEPFQSARVLAPKIIEDVAISGEPNPSTEIYLLMDEFEILSTPQPI